MPACKNINPLQLSGSSQLQRVMAALSPQSAPIDDRTAADIILFAKEYAQHLQYYNNDNIVDGNWQALMQMDIAVVLATLAKENMPIYEAFRRGINTEILSSSVEADCKKLLEALFDVLFTFFYQLDEQYLLLPDGSEAKDFIKSIITGKLKDTFLLLSAYYVQGKAASLVDDSVLYIPPQLFPPANIRSAKDLLSQPLSNIWQGAMPAVPGFSGATIFNQIKNLVTHNLFNAVIDTILKSIGAIATYAETALQNKLTNFPQHTPHYALFLTFVQLFQHAKDQLNTLTEQHLQFYYQRVLQLKNNPAIPDQAHLVIELQKNVNDLLIPAGTAFNAGKDADKKEIFYAVQKDFTVNKASIKTLHSLLAEQHNDLNGNYLTVYSGAIANSEDGAGAALTSPDKSWYPFGLEKKWKNTADIGFAIASKELYLQEGDRVITITFNLKKNISLSASQLQNSFSVKLTGEKNWIDIDPAKLNIQFKSNQLFFIITLDGKTPAITGYNAKVHQGQFNTSQPIIQFHLNIGKNIYNPLLALSNMQVSSININTQVQGIKKLTVSTDTGAVDSAKPFMPFGASPHLGSSLIIGSEEVFQKNITGLEIEVQWDKLPDGGLDLFEKENYPYNDGIKLRYRKHQAVVSYLQNGVWKSENTLAGLFTGDQLFHDYYFSSWYRSGKKYSSDNLLDGNDYDAISCPLTKFQAAAFDNLSEEKYSVNSKDGFVKLELAGNDFGHDDYLNQLLNVTITTNGDTQIISRPKPPYTPVIKSIEINYSSSGQITVIPTQEESATQIPNSDSAFYHLYPFGYRQINNNDFCLLPAFNNEGELFIGLDNAQPPQRISLLFQLSEGSANPLKDKQDVDWSYLTINNYWQLFDKNDIEDHTNGLLQSGLIIFNLKNDISNSAPLMGSNLRWLRASVVQSADAVCKIISIDAQGILVTFSDINNAGNYYKAHVPANTISKLVISNPLIKKITQPYDSFGGRAKENNDAFYVRVSERLRHKQRAINIWDYEHLVLQQFPEIYKVKCMDHTGLQSAPGGQLEWNEGWPGHVAVVTIPDLKNKNSVDPLMPYTPLGKLQEIQNYLSQLVSPFVKLKVINPQFEQVQFNFKVHFFKEYDATVYRELLNDSITQFLSPWAFDTGADIEFGGKISKSVVLKFIEDQYYVDYVSCFKMNHWIDTENNIILFDVEEAVASTSRSILVSYHNADTAVQHLIQPILNETATCDCT